MKGQSQDVKGKKDLGLRVADVRAHRDQLGDWKCSCPDSVTYVLLT